MKKQVLAAMIALLMNSETNAFAATLEPFGPRTDVRQSRSLIPNVFAAARGLPLSDTDLDRYISASVTGEDRKISHRLMALMPINQRGDFTYLDWKRHKLVSNNPQLLKYIEIKVTPRNGPGKSPEMPHRDRPRSASPFDTSPCGPPNPPSNPQGGYVRTVSGCTFTGGWGFVNVECNTTSFNSREGGYMYMEMTGPESLTEAGFQYNSDSSVRPWLKIASNNYSGQMVNHAAVYACGQQLAMVSGLTFDPEGDFYLQVGQLPSDLDPETEWITSEEFTLNNAAWLFTPAAPDDYEQGTDIAGNPTPCLTCSVAKVVTLAQNQTQTYQLDGSYFGVEQGGSNKNAITWNQLAFGNWGSDCYSGTTLCTMYFSPDPSVYFWGEQFYPSSEWSQTDSYPTGYGPYESYDGIQLSTTRALGNPLGSYNEPFAPMPCSPDSLNMCANMQQYLSNGACDTGQQNPHGAEIYVYAYQYVYAVYQQRTPPQQLEIATETETVPRNWPCTMTKSWSPNEPKVQYNDPSLP